MAKSLEITLPVEGMTCAACAARIEKNVGRMEGIQEVNVNLASERARVILDDSTSWQDVVSKIEKTGYHVPFRELDLNIEGMTCAATRKSFSCAWGETARSGIIWSRCCNPRNVRLNLPKGCSLSAESRSSTPI